MAQQQSKDSDPSHSGSLNQLHVSQTLQEHRRAWFRRLREEVFEEGRPYALAAPVAPHEIFEALDIPFITDAWYSGLVAAKRQSAYYSDVLAEHGYHKGLSRYTTMPLAVMLDDDRGRAPWGGLPAPAMVVSRRGDDDYRAAEVVAQLAGVPFVSLELPSLQKLHPDWWRMSRWQWEDLDTPERIDMMVSQFEEIIAHAERIAGKKLDPDRLAELLDRVNRQEEHFDEVRTLVCEAPKTPVRMAEGMSQTMGIQWHRGTPWALEQARAFRDEVAQRVTEEQWAYPGERYRLMWLGTGLWQNLKFFTEFEEPYGAVFVRSNYLSIASDGYLRYGLRDPLRALASRYSSVSEQMHIPGLGSAWAIWEAQRHRVDAALAIKGWWGMTLLAKDLEDAGIPVLEIEVDSVDSGTWDADRFHAQVSRFLEERVVNRPPASERQLDGGGPLSLGG